MHSSRGRGPSAGLNNVVVFHERNRAVTRYTRFGPARQSTTRRGGRRLETYYVNVFFIEELRPDTARPCSDHVAILPINFHSAEHLPGYIRGLGGKEKKRGEESVFHSALSGMQIALTSLRPVSLGKEIFSSELRDSFY